MEPPGRLKVLLGKDVLGPAGVYGAPVAPTTAVVVCMKGTRPTP